MDYEDLYPELREIIEINEYGDFCFRDIYEVVRKYLENHTLTISELGDIFGYIAWLIQDKENIDSYNWEDWTDEDE